VLLEADIVLVEDRAGDGAEAAQADRDGDFGRGGDGHGTLRVWSGGEASASRDDEPRAGGEFGDLEIAVEAERAERGVPGVPAIGWATTVARASGRPVWLSSRTPRIEPAFSSAARNAAIRTWRMSEKMTQRTPRE
jgi:hypothetical protein